MCQCPNGPNKCGCSTHIGGDISCGWGELDPNGFWEYGCYECARELEEKLSKENFEWFSGRVWPYSKEYVKFLLEKKVTI